MLRSKEIYQMIHWDNYEVQHLRERIYLEEMQYLEELEWEESRKSRKFEVREPRKPNSKYGRAKIIRKTSSIRRVLKASKHKSTILQGDDRDEPLY